ncbi:MAG: glycoside-pentoside-hexuronide (GPH):cation symporter [Anaerofustis sp.]
MKTELTSKKERFSYFGFFFGQNIIYVILFQYLAYYYTEGVGLAPVAVSVLLFVAKMWDAINDPIMGIIIDKTHFKSGNKFLPWIRFVIYALPLLTFLVFCNFGGSMASKLFFAYLTYIAWGMIYTIGDAPIFSLATVMTDNTNERDKLMTYGRFGAPLAALASAVFLTVKGSVGYAGTALIYAAIAFLFMMPVQFFAKERITYRRNTDIPIKTIVSAILKNKYLMLYFTGFLATEITNTIQIMAAYFANSNLGNENLTTVILAATIIPLLAVVPFLPKLIQAFGKRKLTIICSSAFIIVSVAQYFIGYDSFVLFLAISIVRVIFMQIPMLIYGMFTADCMEYGAYTTKQRTEGLAFSIQTFVTKLGGALASAVSLWLLQYFGYIQQSTSQSAQALGGIWALMTIIPPIGYVVMLVIMVFFYDLKEADVQRMIDEMKQSRTESAE